MSNQLTEAELAALMPSELCQYQTPIPTQIVSSDEFYPDPQNERQREVEARLLAMADDLGGKQGLDRRRFFQTAAGMAASFVAMNEVYGPLFEVTKAEAATPGDGAGTRRRAQRPVHHGHAHAFPARRHPHHELRRDAQGGRQGRLEQAARRSRADHRGPQVQQLQEGDVSRQRHQDLADLVGAVRHRAGLVPDQRADGGRAQEDQRRGRLAAGVRAHDLHAGAAGLARQARRRRSR